MAEEKLGVVAAAAATAISHLKGLVIVITTSVCSITMVDLKRLCTC